MHDSLFCVLFIIFLWFYLYVRNLSVVLLGFIRYFYIHSFVHYYLFVILVFFSYRRTFFLRCVSSVVFFPLSRPVFPSLLICLSLFHSLNFFYTLNMYVCIYVRVRVCVRVYVRMRVRVINLPAR